MDQGRAGAALRVLYWQTRAPMFLRGFIYEGEEGVLLVVGAVQWERWKTGLISPLQELYRPCKACQEIESGIQEPHLDAVSRC